jgi:hypothetical protein
MKIIRIALAILAAVWTIGVAVGVISRFGQHEGPRAATDIFGGIAAIAVCTLITVWLFQERVQKETIGIRP